jgi:protoporphyrinogen/coproporphyrinogen III oxidase
MRVGVVGGGIAGLSVAHALVRRKGDLDVVVLEGAERPGGNIRSERIDGFLCEWGANGFLDSVKETLELVRDLGLEERVQRSDDRARRRFVFRSGRLHELPGGPLAFLGSGLISWRAKLRILMEPFAAGRPEGDETIHAFASRRIGREAADILIDSMVSGVFGGDARRLSLRACFPKMWQMETDHGGLFRALFAKRRERRARRGEGIGSPVGRLTSFREGTEELIRGLAARLGPRLHLRAQVTGLEARDGRYRLALAGGDGLDADAVVLAGGAAASAAILDATEPEMAGVLREIQAAPLAVVCLGFEEARLERRLDGFGFLVPRGEGPRLLGALWDSSIYPGRAPAGRALIRVMLGGAHDPKVVELADDELLEIVRRELLSTMGLGLAPCFTKIFRHPFGIPQYVVGHRDRLSRLSTLIGRRPGLYLAGNAFNGVAINSCVAEAGPLAERVLAGLGGALLATA